MDCERIIQAFLAEGFYNLKFDGAANMANRYKLHGALRLLEALVPALKAAGLIRDDYELPSLICPACVREYFLGEGSPIRRCQSPGNTHLLQPGTAPRSCPMSLLPAFRPLTEANVRCEHPERSTSECCWKDSDRP